MRIPSKFFQVSRNTLYFLAGLVWCIAGGNVLNIGVHDMIYYWKTPVLHIVGALIVFALFFFCIFFPMVKKHHVRIEIISTPKVSALQFFDKKGYCIMACMIPFGIILRTLQIVPSAYLGTFYTGLGFALFLAGIVFFCIFIQNVRHKRKSHPFIVNKTNVNACAGIKKS